MGSLILRIAYTDYQTPTNADHVYFHLPQIFELPPKLRNHICTYVFGNYQVRLSLDPFGLKKNELAFLRTSKSACNEAPALAYNGAIAEFMRDADDFENIDSLTDSCSQLALSSNESTCVGWHSHQDNLCVFTGGSKRTCRCSWSSLAAKVYSSLCTEDRDVEALHQRGPAEDGRHSARVRRGVNFSVDCQTSAFWSSTQDLGYRDSDVLIITYANSRFKI